MHNISVGILKFYIEMSVLTWSGHLIQLPKYGPLDARQDSTPFLHGPLPLIQPLYQGCIIKHIQSVEQGYFKHWYLKYHEYRYVKLSWQSKLLLLLAKSLHIRKFFLGIIQLDCKNMLFLHWSLVCRWSSKYILTPCSRTLPLHRIHHSQINPHVWGARLQL